MTARLSVVIEYDSANDMPRFGPSTNALGGRVIAFAVGDRLTDPNEPETNERERFAGLSMREQQVLAGLAAGHCTSRIATELRISRKTVCSYRYRIHDQLGVGNDILAVQMYQRVNKQ